MKPLHQDILGKNLSRTFTGVPMINKYKWTGVQPLVHLRQFLFFGKLHERSYGRSDLALVFEDWDWASLTWILGLVPNYQFCNQRHPLHGQQYTAPTLPMIQWTSILLLFCLFLCLSTRQNPDFPFECQNCFTLSHYFCYKRSHPSHVAFNSDVRNILWDVNNIPKIRITKAKANIYNIRFQIHSYNHQ